MVSDEGERIRWPIGNTGRNEVKMMYKIMLESWGGTRKVLIEDMSYDDALEFCESYNWEYCMNGGYIWDMIIDEQ